MFFNRLLAASVAAGFTLAGLPAFAADPPATAAGAVRVQPTIHALAMPVDAKPAVGSQAAVSAKPVLATAVPGPLSVMRGRVNADGVMEVFCSVDHDHLAEHPTLGTRREQQR